MLHCIMCFIIGRFKSLSTTFCALHKNYFIALPWRFLRGFGGRNIALPKPPKGQAKSYLFRMAMQGIHRDILRPSQEEVGLRVRLGTSGSLPVPARVFCRRRKCRRRRILSGRSSPTMKWFLNHDRFRALASPGLGSRIGSDTSPEGYGRDARKAGCLVVRFRLERSR